ncbi:sodium bile acid symporter family protein [Chitinophaga polysaccharea]|uniref:Sodium bile acid symporter family protein n=1 Tax=Chitinophaga polysaccharea TaxID=1293035 RepID=A0A561PQP0_9BACT|nr:sodium bile acid symporter family protein [Chitinophaga polysaccharea]
MSSLYSIFIDSRNQHIWGFGRPFALLGLLPHFMAMAIGVGIGLILIGLAPCIAMVIVWIFLYAAFACGH